MTQHDIMYRLLPRSSLKLINSRKIRFLVISLIAWLRISYLVYSLYGSLSYHAICWFKCIVYFIHECKARMFTRYSYVCVCMFMCVHIFNRWCDTRRKETTRKEILTELSECVIPPFEIHKAKKMMAVRKIWWAYYKINRPCQIPYCRTRCCFAIARSYPYKYIYYISMRTQSRDRSFTTAYKINTEENIFAGFFFFFVNKPWQVNNKK